MNIPQKFSLLIAIILIVTASCSSKTEAPATMAGFWQDDENNVTTIQEKDGSYAAVTVYDMDQSHSQNLLVSSAYENGVLTWKYCPPAKICLMMQTTSFNGDALDITWTNDKGESGKMTLKRVDKGTNF